MARKSQAVLNRNSENKTETLAVQEQEFDSPTLHVDQLEQLHQFRPDLVDWVIKQVEEESDFRRAHVAKVTEHVHKDHLTGQIFGLLIGLSGVVGGSLVAIYSSPTAGGTIATVAIGTLAVAFLKRN